MNSVNIIARITKDLEIRYIPTTNTPVCNFSVALNDGFGDKKKTYYFNCQAWQKTAENLVKFVSKGDLIGISGKLTTRDWTDKDGKKHTVTEIVVSDFTFCGGKKKESNTEIKESFVGSDLLEDEELPFK